MKTIDGMLLSDDVVHHPSHYTQGKIEVWDFIVDQRLGYLDGNIIKYVCRFRHKNGVEDLKKARAYLNKLIETCEGGDAL